MQKVIDKYSYDEQIKDCNYLFEKIVKTIQKTPGYVVDLVLLRRAYELAREKHGNVRRRSGELYLQHPLSVMESLSRLMCKTSVLAAALLHDTMEDTDVTYELLRENFSYEVAEIVSAVTAIKREEKESDFHFHSMTSKEQHEFLDRLTDAKLIATPYQREAMLVRFADREHNLSTIDACSDGKRQEKIASTRGFLIPAAKRLGMNYFDIVLNDLCLRFEGDDLKSNRSISIRENFTKIIKVSGSAYKSFDQAIQDAVESQAVFSFPRYNPFANLRSIKKEAGGEMQTSQRRALTLYEIDQQTTNSVFERSKLDLWEVLLTCSEEYTSSMLTKFISLFKTYLKESGLFMEYVGKCGCAEVVRLTDVFENNYRVVLVPDAKLEEYFIGDANGDRLTMIDEEAPGDALRPQITVYTFTKKKGYRKFSKCIPLGATVLDFAFFIRHELGFSVKSAMIHPYKEGISNPFSEDDYKYPLWTILNDGDVVHFDADYASFPVNPSDPATKYYIHYENHSTFDWFSYINTETAKNCLIRYLKEKYL